MILLSSIHSHVYTYVFPPLLINGLQRIPCMLHYFQSVQSYLTFQPEPTKNWGWGGGGGGQIFSRGRGDTPKDGIAKFGDNNYAFTGYFGDAEYFRLSYVSKS